MFRLSTTLVFSNEEIDNIKIVKSLKDADKSLKSLLKWNSWKWSKIRWFLGMLAAALGASLLENVIKKLFELVKN